MHQLGQFAAALWEPTDLIEVRSLPSERGGFPQPESRFIYAEDLLDIRDKLEKMNTAGHNHFVGVLPRNKKGGTTDIDCLPSTVLWADFDAKKETDEDGNVTVTEVTPDEALARLIEHKIPAPYMILNSGHGTHVYWKMEEKVPAYMIAKTVHDLAVLLEADTAVANPSRIMRLPGFDNLKKPVKPVEIVSINKDAVHSFDEFKEYVPSADYYSGVTKPEGFGDDWTVPRKRRDIVARAEAYVDAFDPTLDGERNHSAFALAACLQKDFALDQDEAWHALQHWNNTKCSPPITENELYSCLMSGQRYGKKEVGCKLEEDKKSEERPDRVKPTKKTEEAAGGIADRIKAQIREEFEGTRRSIPLPWDGLKDLPLLFPGKVGVITGFPGASKSYLALNVGKMVKKAALEWSYIPLEDDKTYHTRRLLSVVDGSWEMATPFDATSKKRVNQKVDEIDEQYRDLIEQWESSVLENPVFLPDGTMQAIEHDEALDLVQSLCEKQRLVIIDPIAQIDFVGKNTWQVQEQWMRDIVSVANKTEATILLIIHRAKRDNAGVYGVEGTKRFTDLAHTVLSVSSHNGGALMERNNEEIEEDINRIITVEKCRDSPLQGTEWGYMFGDCGPLFSEKGKIIKKSR